MYSVVGKLRKDLELLGEYVVRANISSGWFAILPRTWSIRAEAARRDGRAGPTLIVYRTNSGDPRDHYAIPYDIFHDLLVDDTITHSEVDGSRRWNLTLKNGRLHVTHRPGTRDVREYYGATLMIEDAGTSVSSQLATLAFEDNFAIIEGIVREVTGMARSRSRKLRDLALKRSNGMCAACGTNFSLLFAGKGLQALQVHHRRQLALRDAPEITRPDDVAVVCANCHAIIHADRLSAMSVEALRDQWIDERAESLNPRKQIFDGTALGPQRGQGTPVMSAKPQTIDEYLAPLSDEKRAVLEKLRKAIQTAAPEAEECISYQIPGFRLGGRLLVSFGAAANHCAFYPGAHPVKAHEDELKAYDASKGTIRFPADSPLPATLVRKLVKTRIAEYAAKRPAAVDGATRRR